MPTPVLNIKLFVWTNCHLHSEKFTDVNTIGKYTIMHACFFASHNYGAIVWQYGLWSFQTGGTKLETFLPKSKYSKKIIDF